MAAAMLFAFALPVHAAQSGIRTFTHMTIQTHEVAGVTVSEFTVHVTSMDGEALTGAVVLEEGDKTLAGAALTDGVATLTPALSAGSHQITAVYQGDGLHSVSTSSPERLSPQQQSTTPTYAISLNPASLSLTAGQAGDTVVTVTPSNNQTSTSPTFFTLSCSGLPAQTSCYFTPENVQIPTGSNAAVTSSFTLQTQGQSGGFLNMPTFKSNKGTIALAILLPGILALGWLGRRRSSLIRLMMLALVVLAASFGFSGCAARYTYYNHGPPPNVATPSGNYTITITAQTNNGVTASNVTTTLALTVK
jgi:hypothetical protein